MPGGANVRVIGGAKRGHRLDAPAGTLARPTTDRVKESMFNLMGPNWSGHVAIDLFAGSGALGIEALSRGATHAVFVDKSPKSMTTVRSNLTKLQLLGESTLLVADWQSGWKRISGSYDSVGWVFIDPPYAKGLWDSVLQTIADSPVVVVHGIVCEHPKDVVLPERVQSLCRLKDRAYGDIAVTLYMDERAER